MLKFFHHRLDNGLDVIAEINPAAHSTAAGLFVKTGSRDESPAIAGVSHFLEHMMFKGSQKYTWQDVGRIFDEIGARYNAFTGQEMTAYYANVLPEFTKRAVEHLSHLLRPAIRQADFDTEKKVILEEIAMYLDDPEHRLYEAAMKTHYRGHPMGKSVLGSARSIRALKRIQMADFFRKRYAPGNMVLAATGHLNFPQFLYLAEKFCGDWPPAAPPTHPSPPSLSASRRAAITDPKLNRHYVMGISPAPSGLDPRRFASHVLADCIGDSEGSRLFWALVDNAVAEAADFAFEPNLDSGIYSLLLITDPRRAAKAQDIALRELNRINTDLSDDEVRRAKNKIASGIVLEGESPLGRLRAIASQWIYEKNYRSLDTDMKTLTALTTNDLRQVLADFPIQPRTLVTLGPK